MIHGLSRGQIERICQSLNQPAYRAKQIWQRLYTRYAVDWQEMKNLPDSLRQAFEQRFSLHAAVPVRVQGNRQALSPRKLLLALQDGECVETVVIPAKRRITVCVSSQVGCKFRCAFCASGQAGFKRDLQSGEMVGQITAAAREFRPRPPANSVKSSQSKTRDSRRKTLSHVVFMGIGEPLDNYDQVLDAIRIINDPNGLNIGARRITISTCGIIPGIQRLACEGLQVELSVSLHACDDVLRSRLMPVNRKYRLNDLLNTCREYADVTGRIITFEYTLIRGVNDSIEQAKTLARILGPVHCRVNLIPLSVVAEFKGRPTPRAAAVRFANILERAHINATLRASQGSRINAACGQLRVFPYRK